MISAGIRTHDHRNVSLFPLPLDQGFIFSMLKDYEVRFDGYH